MRVEVTDKDELKMTTKENRVEKGRWNTKKRRQREDYCPNKRKKKDLSQAQMSSEAVVVFPVPGGPIIVTTNKIKYQLCRQVDERERERERGRGNEREEV